MEPAWRLGNSQRLRAKLAMTSLREQRSRRREELPHRRPAELHRPGNCSDRLALGLQLGDASPLPRGDLRAAEWLCRRAKHAINTFWARPPTTLPTEIFMLRSTLSLLLLTTPQLVHAQAIFSDGFDSGIAAWAGNGEPGVQLTWIPTDGGTGLGTISVVGSVVAPTHTAYQAWGPCFDADLAPTWILRGQVKKEGVVASRCFLQIQAFTGANCSGEGSGQVNVPDIPPNQWLQRGTSLTVSPSLLSLRPALTTLANQGTSGAECRFDDIELLLEGVPPHDIPALSASGAAAMTVAVLVTAALILRRRRHVVAGVGLLVLLITPAVRAEQSEPAATLRMGNYLHHLREHQVAIRLGAQPIPSEVRDLGMHPGGN